MMIKRRLKLSLDHQAKEDGPSIHTWLDTLWVTSSKRQETAVTVPCLLGLDRVTMESYAG